MIIESKAPTRVDFAGGTLDIWPLYLFHPSAVTVNAAISLYASCVIETNDPGNSRIKLVSRDIKCEESFPSFAALVKAKRYRLPDRKSTRLNSSHLVISYAVFCLKKKKKILLIYHTVRLPMNFIYYVLSILFSTLFVYESSSR